MADQVETTEDPIPYVNMFGAGWEVSGAQYTPTKLGGVECDENGNIKPIQ
jgi:hypothetical protein